MPEMSLADLGLDQVRNFAPPMPEGDLGAGLMGLGRGLKAVGQGIAQQVATPGRLMAPNPWPEGTEQWHWYEDQKSSAAMQWAPEMAVNMIGSPAAVGGLPGTVGSGIKAFHSSPHDFDRFDLSKIGTGEGAQVYGHGLYFAENPAVSGQGGQYWKQFKDRFSGTPEGTAATYLQSARFDREKAAQMLRDSLARDEARASTFTPSELSDYRALVGDRKRSIEMIESGKPVGPRTYEVNINADPAHMLDWDKPLAEQPVFGKMDAYKTGEGGNLYDALRRGSGRRLDPEEISGGRAVQALQRDLGPGGASHFMSREGIPGIKYLDEGSRNARPVLKTDRAGNVISSEYAPPTSNYVVFDPSIVNIMKKYGIAGAAPGSLMALQALQDERQQQ